jgi:hypothetical protein
VNTTSGAVSDTSCLARTVVHSFEGGVGEVVSVGDSNIFSHVVDFRRFVEGTWRFIATYTEGEAIQDADAGISRFVVGLLVTPFDDPSPK